MVAHDGHEAAPLHPAHLQLLHGHVFQLLLYSHPKKPPMSVFNKVCRRAK